MKNIFLSYLQLKTRARIVGAMKSKQQKPWFVRVRGSYLPISWQGWLTYIPFVTFLAWGLEVLYRRFGRIDVVVILYVPVAVSAVVVMTWIAKQES